MEEYLNGKGIKSYSERKLKTGQLADVYLYDKKLALEVKRIVTSGQIYNYIEETSKKYPNTTNEVDTVLMFFIFKKEDQYKTDHFNWAVNGYRSLF